MKSFIKFIIISLVYLYALKALFNKLIKLLASFFFAIYYKRKLLFYFYFLLNKI